MYTQGLQENDKFFMAIPNIFIKCDLQKTFGISKKFHFIYASIARYCSYEGQLFISLQKILELCGCKIIKKQSNSFEEVLHIIDFMVANKMISLDKDVHSISLDEIVEIKINPKKFNVSGSGFTRLHLNQFDYVLQADCSATFKENIFAVFLYVLFYIEASKYYKEHPEKSKSKNLVTIQAFYKSQDNTASDIGLSSATVQRCLKLLSSPQGDKEPLLIKQDPIRFSFQSGTVCSTPAIYVLNQPGYENELRLATEQLKELYHLSGSSADPDIDGFNLSGIEMYTEADSEF